MLRNNENENKNDIIDEDDDVDTNIDMDIDIDDEEVDIYKEDISISDFKAVDDSFGVYLKEISRYPLLTLEQELELTTKYKETGDIEVKQKIINSNLRLVVNIAKHYKIPNIPVLDIIQEGNLGLMKAVELYEPEKGYKLSTYATWWIKQSITRYLSNNSRLIRIPVHANDVLYRYNKYMESWKLQNINKPLPSIEDIAKELNVSLTVLKDCIRSMDIASLDSPVGVDDDQESLLVDFVSSDESITVQSERKALKECVYELLDDLKERERDVIIKRFGLYGYRQHTLEEVGKEYGISRERVRQIESKGIRKLRHPKRKSKLRDFLNG